MANSPIKTPTPAPTASAPWNPIDAARQRYPGLKDWSDQEIYSNLAEPGKFRQMFPQYAGLPDNTIQQNMQKFVPADYSKTPSQFAGPLPAGLTGPKTAEEPLTQGLTSEQWKERWGQEASVPVKPGLLQRAEAFVEPTLQKLETPLPKLGAALLPGPTGTAEELSKLGKQIPPSAPGWEQAVAGAAEAPKALLNALTSPENMLLMGGMASMPEKGILAKLVTGGFTAQQAYQAFSQFKGGYQAIRSGDYKKAGFLLTSAPVTTLFALLGADKLAGDLAKAVKPEVATEKLVKGPVISKEPLKPEQAALPEPKTASQKVEAIRTEAQAKEIRSVKPKPTPEFSQQTPEEQYITQLQTLQRHVVDYTKNPTEQRSRAIKNYFQDIDRRGKELGYSKDHVAADLGRYGGFTLKQPTTPKVAPAKVATPEESLTRLVATSKPRYGYQDKLFNLNFQDPVDKALYTVAQPTKNRIHDSVMQHLQKIFPNETPGQIMLKGKSVRDAIKGLAQQRLGTEEDSIDIPAISKNLRPTITPAARPLVAKAKPAIPTQIQSPVAKQLFYPDAQAAEELQALERKHAAKITDIGIQKSQTELDKLNHTLEQTGSGRVAEINEAQRNFLLKERAKVQRELKFNMIEQAKRMSPAERSQALVQHQKDAATKLSIGQALIGLAKSKEAAPAWLEEYRRSFRIKDPKLSKGILASMLKQMRKTALTEDDLAPINAIDEYFAKLHEAEARLGQSIPASMDKAHLRRLGEKYTREGQFASSMAKVLEGRLGTKVKKPVAPVVQPAEVVATAPVKEVAPPVAEETPELEPAKEVTPVEEEPIGPQLTPVQPSRALSYEELQEKAVEEGEGTEPGRVEAVGVPDYLEENLADAGQKKAFDQAMGKALETSGASPEQIAGLLKTASPQTWLNMAELEKTPVDVKAIIHKFNQREIALTTPIHKTLALAPHSSDPKIQELLHTADYYEGMVQPDEFDKIRSAVPKHFTQEKQLNRYIQSLQKFIELDEDEDPKALTKAVAMASRDPEKGAVTVSTAKADPLTVLKRVRAAGWEAGFTASSKAPEAAWISPEGPDQIWAKVDLYTSHEHMANVMLDKPKPDFAKLQNLTGQARLAALNKLSEAMDQLLSEGWIRKASKNAYEVGKFTPNSLKDVVSHFQKDLYELRQTNQDPALFISASRDLKGKRIRGKMDMMEIPTSWSQIEQANGDLFKVATDYLGRYSRANSPELYSGILIHKGIPAFKRLWSFVKSWSLHDIDADAVPDGFIEYWHHREVATDSLREVMGTRSQANAKLKNALQGASDEWDAVPVNQQADEFRNFFEAYHGNQKFTNPEHEALANTLKAMFDDRYNQLVVLDKAPQYLENYFPGIWSNVGKAQKFARGWLGKRPFEGKKSFLRHKVYPTIPEALDAGLVPHSFNPVKQALIGLESMDRFLTAQKAQNLWKDMGLMKFTKSYQKLPAVPDSLRWKKIDDPISSPMFRTKDKLLAKAGDWYTLAPLADAMNNYLKPGWNKHILYRGVRQYVNTMNMFQLGISAFHGFQTLLNSQAMSVGLGMQHLRDAIIYQDPARLGKAASSIIEGLAPGVALFDHMMLGAKIKENWLGDKYPDFDKITDRLIKANANFEWQNYYYENDLDAVRRNWALGSMQHPLPWAKAVAHMLPAIMRVVIKPIMDIEVPRTKLGVAAKFMERQLYLESKGDIRYKTPEQQMVQGARIWDRIDDVFGEMQLDNLMWPRAAVEIGKGAIRSSGWTYGTARLVEHGLLDPTKELVKLVSGKRYASAADIPTATAYWIGLGTVAGALGLLLNVMINKKLPQKPKDAYVIPAGGLDSNGNPNHVWIKDYMSDMVEFLHAPTHTILNKMSPAFTDAYELLKNKDFYGYQIWDPRLGPFSLQNWYNVLRWKAIGTTPLSIRNWLYERSRGAAIGAQIGASMGLQPAPSFVTNSALENRLNQVLSPKFSQGPRTFEERAHIENIRKYREMWLSGKISKAELIRKIQTGEIKLRPGDAEKLLKRTVATSLDTKFQQATLTDALWAWQVANKSEKDQLAGILAKKAGIIPAQEIDTWSPEQAKNIQQQLYSALAQYPQEQIASQIYMQAAKERIDWHTEHLGETKQTRPPWLTEMFAGTGMKHFTAPHGPGIRAANTLNKIDSHLKAAMQKQDTKSVDYWQNDRREFLFQWWSDYTKANSRANTPIPIHIGGTKF